MNDLLARVALISGALLVAAIATYVLRHRARGAPRRIDSPGLGQGVYLFSSTACPDCRSVRRTLEAALGPNGFEETSWEEDPGLFHQLGVTAVPATLIVDSDGTGMLWPGRPDRALAGFGP